MTKTIVVYTDGACTGNGKPCAKGGIGVHFPDKELEDLSLPFENSPITNQRAELAAIHTALKHIRRGIGLTDIRVLIKTDSKYSIDCLTEWIRGWIKNGWKTKKNEPVLNQDYIKIIYVYLQKYDIRFEHVKSHTGRDDYDSIHNDIADRLATAGIADSKIICAPSNIAKKVPKTTSVHTTSPYKTSGSIHSNSYDIPNPMARPKSKVPFNPYEKQFDVKFNGDKLEFKNPALKYVGGRNASLSDFKVNLIKNND
jgi:ribonuclease HI